MCTVPILFLPLFLLILAKPDICLISRLEIILLSAHGSQVML
ncbi:hypothetical protein DSUL_60081 [Desulfovibrionales bacterium]